MSEFEPDNSEKQRRGRPMSSLCEASTLLRQIAAPETGKAARLKAYRKIGQWSFNRVKDVFYADPRIRITAEEMDLLRALAKPTNKQEERDADEFSEISTRLNILEKRMEAELEKLRGGNSAADRAGGDGCRSDDSAMDS